jgi:hypothetical protein
VVWHFYGVIFDPDVYPLNPACLDGRISEAFQAHEHPLENSAPPPGPEAVGPSNHPTAGDYHHPGPP